MWNQHQSCCDDHSKRTPCFLSFIVGRLKLQLFDSKYYSLLLQLLDVPQGNGEIVEVPTNSPISRVPVRHRECGENNQGRQNRHWQVRRAPRKRGQLPQGFLQQHDQAVPEKEGGQFQGRGCKATVTNARFFVASVPVMIKECCPHVVMDQSRHQKGNDNGDFGGHKLSSRKKAAVFQDVVDHEIPLATPEIRGRGGTPKWIEEGWLGQVSFHVFSKIRQLKSNQEMEIRMDYM